MCQDKDNNGAALFWNYRRHCVDLLYEITVNQNRANTERRQIKPRGTLGDDATLQIFNNQ